MSKKPAAQPPVPEETGGRIACGNSMPPKRNLSWNSFVVGWADAVAP